MRDFGETTSDEKDLIDPDDLLVAASEMDILLEGPDCQEKVRMMARGIEIAERHKEFECLLRRTSANLQN